MNILLAPMHGMTDVFYRNTYAEIFGSIDTYYAPFIGTSTMRRETSSVFNDVLPQENSTLNLVPQLLSNNSEDFHYYASHLTNIGYSEINWNIGCPFHKIARKKRGSGLLPHPDLIKSFLDYLCLNKTYDLSIKMRLGLDHKEEGLEVIELFNDYPLKNVTIHGRVGKQLYTGHVDLDAFEELYTKSSHQIIYNGDITTTKDYEKVQERFPDINDFMIGRGALNNPFLASSIKGINYSTKERLDKLIFFHEKIFNYYTSKLSSERGILNKMKEFWVYLSMTIDPTKALLSQITQCQTIRDYHTLINLTFSTSSQWIDNF